MKTTLFTGILSIIAISAFSQMNDTLGISEFRNGTPILYSSPNGGFALGNNGYGDKVKAQSFQYDSPFILSKVLIEFGEVIFGSADSSSLILVNIYDNYGQGVLEGTSAQQDSIAPDSIWASVSIPVYQLINNGEFTVADFGSTLIDLPEANFSVGVDFGQMSIGDTVGLVSTTDGEPYGTNQAWELTADSVWFHISESSFSWGLDVQLAIFPVFEIEPASIREEEVSFSIYPNPSDEYLNLNFTKAEFNSIEIIDASGRSVLSSSSNQLTKTINVSNLSSGLYFLTVSNKRFHSAQQFIKQ